MMILILPHGAPTTVRHHTRERGVHFNMATNITASDFEEKILNSPIPVLVDFWAEWCGPCKMLTPVVEELFEEADGYSVAKVNIDDEPELAQQYGVMSIPTLMLFQDGQPTGQLVGVQPKSAIEDLIRAAL